MEAPAINKLRDIWLISDTHFFHNNIIKYCDRPFHSVEEMNEHMVDKWNSVVKPGDKVYHLGDVLMGPVSPGHFESFWPRFNGSKRLVVGNHDDIKYLSSGGFFQKVMMWRHFKEHNMLLTHVPLHPDHIRHHGVNVHGHIHEKPSPKGPYKCVCVEQPYINYTPIHIEEVLNSKNH